MEFQRCMWILLFIFNNFLLLFVKGQDVDGPFVNLTANPSKTGLCPQGQYGEDCQYECHCPVGTECDSLTGQCPEGCAAGWSGAPYCQARNVALGKKTFQHGTYLGWNSSRAVDGNPDQDGSYGTCAWAHNSDDVFKTWWNVDLERQYVIQSVEVYFRTDDAMSQSRRAGVRIYISHTQEEAKNEGLCYMDQMSDFDFPPNHLTLREGSLTCTQRQGRYVILYVDRPTQTPIRNCPSHTLYSCWANLELCEVEVYACSNGTYGDLCQYRCHCEDGVGCQATSGACPGRCAAGWEGPSCSTKCRSGTYGVDCSQQCGYCTDSVRSCDRVTGQCPTCQSGWTGSRCQDVCPAGSYGDKCEGRCGNCMGTCDPQTGICSIGCKAGWVGPRCTDQCSPGRYGPACESRCANCRGGEPCNHVTGYCDVGCAVGFTGKRCDQGCEAGYYGNGCNQTCGHCHQNLTCDHVTGTCPGGCETGWKGASCTEVCPHGRYGNQCSGECGVCSGNQTCHHVTGICTNGCGDGWTDQKCKNKCLLGSFGPGCTGVCGACKNGDTCNHVTGSCDNGCGEGWTGAGCREVCKMGTYGQNCQNTCGFCKNKTTCHHMTGHCEGGCQGDYYGELCVLSLTVAGKDNSDSTSLAGQDPELSVLIGGIVAGVFVVFVGVVMFVLIRRKKGETRRKSTRRSTHDPPGVVQENGHTNHACTASQSPTPSRTSSLATIKTNCTQSFITIDDQEVLYVNLKKKHQPRTLPIPVPSPKLSSFQRKVVVPDSTGGAEGVLEEEPTYYNTVERLHRQTGNVGVIEEFAQHLREMDADRNCFKTEFTQYPHGLKFPHEAGKRPRNKFKNRFARMFPYDHSRVVLEEDPIEPDSDYINANYIDSVDYPNCYIATQGPNLITVKDFWRMVWQNKCGKIVMLTNLVEESKNKCELYWPEDRGSITMGDLRVQLAACQEYPFYTVRFMTISSEMYPDDVRTIKHFHFTAWPDHGVPDTFEIVSFFKCVLRQSTNLPGPMIVHCSAGVGRSGTFITLDAQYHYAKRGGAVNIPAFVQKLRQQRMNMIQTIEQYRLLHYALLEALEYGDTSISGSTFHSECLRQEELFNGGQKNRIADEYQLLEDLLPKLGNEYFLAALRKENVDKNRSLNVLAADKYRPYLSTYVPDTTDYVNSVVIPSRSSKRGYIITQLPLKSTVVDFWRLVYDHASNVIIQLNALDEDQEECCCWWPSQGDTITFGPLVIETLAVETPCREVTERTFRIVRKGIKESKLVYMITYNDWRADKNLPHSIDSFLVLVQRADLYRKSFPDASITVLCLDGAVGSGVFVATCNVIDQLSRDHEVDIFNTVRQIQMRRPQFIKNKDQYLFLYQSLCRSIETADSHLYGNVL